MVEFLIVSSSPLFICLSANGELANKKGKPFAFKIGSGDVIKGWDIGVQGMAVGGERRITIPAKLAYGNKSLPQIPANSDLVFDLKMISID
jgi:FK506-binding nuclear protein